MGDDGRLELDELGGVIETAQRLDAAAPDGDLLAGGDDAPSWAERIRASGVYFWAERHRRWLMAGAAVVAVGVAVPGVAAHNRLPDVDPTTGIVALAVANDLDGAPAPAVDGGLATAVYQLEQHERGWTDPQVIGVSGPGIRSTEVAAVPVGSGIFPKFRVTAAVGCDLPFGRPAAAQYVLHISATDAYGRVVREDVPAPSMEYSGWYDALGQACWQRVPDQLAVEIGRISADRDRGRITVEAAVTTPAAYDVSVTSAWADAPWLVPDIGAAARVPAGSTADVALPFQVSDCRTPFTAPRAQQIRGDEVAMITGLSAYVTTADQRFGTQLALPLDSAQTDALQRAHDEVCQGMPALRIADVVASTGEPTPDGSGAWDIPVTLRLGTSTPRPLRVSIGDAGLDPIVGMENAAVVGADGTVTARWRVECGYAPSPPALWVQSMSSAPTPQRLRLPLGPLRRALVATCPGIPANDLGLNGWSGGGT